MNEVNADAKLLDDMSSLIKRLELYGYSTDFIQGVCFGSLGVIPSKGSVDNAMRKSIIA